MASLLLLAVFWLAWDGSIAPVSTPTSKRPPSVRTEPDGHSFKGPKLPRSPAGQSLARAPKLRAASHLVCVRDPAGQPVPKLRLSFYCSDTSAPLGAGSLVTDDQGCVELRPCPLAQTVTCVRPAAAGYSRTRAWILSEGAARSEFAFEARVGLEGRVLSPQSTPLEGAKVRVVQDDPDPLAVPAWVQSHALTDEAGGFVLERALAAPCDPCVRDPQDCEQTRDALAQVGDAPEGQLVVIHPDYRQHRIAVQALPKGLVEVVLEPSLGPIAGQVDLEALAKGQRAFVFLQHQDHHEDRQRIDLGPKGSFAFQGLGDGLYELSVFVDGQKRLSRSKLAAGQRLKLRLTRKNSER